MKRAFVPALPTLAAALMLGGCIGPLRRDHEDLEKLMAAYRAQSSAADSAAGVAQAGMTDTVTVIGRWNEPDQRVTLDVDRAQLGSVVARILDEAEHPHLYEVPALSGIVTAHIVDTPLIEALNLLLGQHGYSATLERGLIRIRPGVISPTAAQQAAAGDGEMVSAEIRIANLDGPAISQLLGLASGTVKAVHQPSTGTVYVTGPGNLVREALAILARADRAPAHVLLEALVVEFDRQTLRALGIDFSKAQIGNYKDIILDPGNFGGLLEFTRIYGADHPKQFHAVIQALAATDHARVIARPYVSTRSGEKATVNITQEQHFINPVLAGTGLVTSNGAVTLSSGVKLEITPAVLPGGQVRSIIAVEESQFIPEIEDASAAIDKNFATTTMQVNSGETIVIGGLALERESHGNAGVPVLRNIPLLNLIFSRREKFDRNQEVVIFITPYIWDPSIDPPIPLPRAFGEKDQDKKLRE